MFSLRSRPLASVRSGIVCAFPRGGLSTVCGGPVSM